MFMSLFCNVMLIPDQEICLLNVYEVEIVAGKHISVVVESLGSGGRMPKFQTLLSLLSPRASY